MASRASRSNSKGEKPSTFFSRKSANRSVSCLLNQSPSPRTSTIQSVPSRFSVFLLSRSPHASREQTWSPRESTTHSLPCRFSQSIQYVSLNPRANTTRFVPCLLSQNKLEQARSDMCPAGSVKVGHLEQARAVCALNAQSKWTV